MTMIAGFPYVRVEFDKHAHLVHESQVEALLRAVDPASGISDLFVISHGWNNDQDEAQQLYEAFFHQVRALIDGQAVSGLTGRTFAVMGVFWPSKKFDDDGGASGGAASAGDPLIRALDGLKGVFDHAEADGLLEKAKALVPNLSSSPVARAKFADAIRKLPNRKGQSAATNHEDASDRFFAAEGDELLKRLSAPLAPAPPQRMGGSTGGAAGGIGSVTMSPPAGQAAGIGSLLGDLKAGALNLLNFTTYFQMKERAGVIGSGPVNEVLGRVRSRNAALRIHLVGHSFGGRLVTATAAGKARFAPSTMTLLQAAFSHNGFSPDYDAKGSAGAFRSVVSDGRINGPILVTHSDKDAAVGRAYPLASRISGEQAAALGDANDTYGGIGRNGAIKTPAEAVKGELLRVGAAGYQFAKGKIYNLNSDGCIGGHSDICKPEVAFALLTAVRQAS